MARMGAATRSSRVFFSAGEASGDGYAAALLTRIKDRLPEANFEGGGASRLRDAGATLVADSSGWGAIGILEAIRVGPRVLDGYLRLKEALSKGEPGLFIPIDFGFINIRLARFAKERKWNVLYFIPPGSWRRDKQGADLPKITDAIVTPFSWSRDLLCEMGANAHWFGHPLKEMIGSIHAEERSGLAILPGSRWHEIEANLPVIAEVVERLPPIHAEFALSHGVDPGQFAAKWKELLPVREQDCFTVGDTYGVLQRRMAGIICSGTATLEAAICRCPCTVMYRGTKGMELEARIRKPNIKFIALPNILLDRPVVPEAAMWNAIPEAVFQSLLPLLQDSPERTAQIKAFAELDAELGPSDAISQAADLAASML